MFGIEDSLSTAMKSIKNANADGGTPLIPGLLGSLLNLSRFPNFEKNENRKFIIVITDGVPNEGAHACQKVIQNIKDTGVNIIGIGLNTPAVFDVFGTENSVNISRIEELGHIMSNVLVKIANQEKLDMTKINETIRNTKFNKMK